MWSLSVSIPISRIVKVFLCLIFVWCYVYVREVFADERLLVFWLLTYGVYWLVYRFENSGVLARVMCLNMFGRLLVF